MKREDILKVYEAGPEAVVQHVSRLTASIDELKEQVSKLKERVKILES